MLLGERIRVCVLYTDDDADLDPDADLGVEGEREGEFEGCFDCCNLDNGTDNDVELSFFHFRSMTAWRGIGRDIMIGT